MAGPRVPCCLVPSRRCGTRWSLLLRWACETTGKAVRLVDVTGEQQGRAPFFAQPVGFDGRAFHLAADHGCDTEKLLHEVCHWLVAPRDRRGHLNYGLGPVAPEVDAPTRDNEEVTTMLLERLLAPRFALPETRIARPDYNVADRRHVDWRACALRAQALRDRVAASLPAPAGEPTRPD